MRVRLRLITLAALASLAFAFALPASTASAITSPRCSVEREDFLALIYGNQHIACFANAGVVAVNLPRVDGVHTGNNKVTLQYEFAGRYYAVTLQKWTSGWSHNAAGDPVRVFEVRIW
jgi:hypothetical protein